jgi:hypothetical protein
MAVPGTVHDFWNPGEDEAHVLLPCHPIQRCWRSPGWRHRIRALPAIRPGRMIASLRSGRYQRRGGIG